MSLVVSLTTLRTLVLQRANMENSTFITTGLASELDGHINAGLRELYEEVLSSYGEEYYVSSATFTTSAGVDTYAIDATLLKLLGVDAVFNGTTISLQPFMFRERNKYKSDVTYANAVRPLAYRLQGQNIKFIPIPSGSVSVTVWFIPAPTTLVNGGDTFDGQAGWEEFIIWSAVASLLAKEESDTTYAIAMKEAARMRVRQQAPNRDVGAPERVTDVQREELPWWVLMS
jgi:hypothetical protein